jgi:hypothetical protein
MDKKLDEEVKAGKELSKKSKAGHVMIHAGINSSG